MAIAPTLVAAEDCCCACGAPPPLLAPPDDPLPAATVLAPSRSKRLARLDSCEAELSQLRSMPPASSYSEEPSPELPPRAPPPALDEGPRTRMERQSVAAEFAARRPARIMRWDALELLEPL